LIAVNLAGTAFGFYYYLPQFGAVQPFLWPLVADSPVATLVFALCLVARETDRGLTWLEAFAFLSNVKYGLWTAAVLLLLHDGFLASVSSGMYVFLLLSHLGMAAQALALTDTGFDTEPIFGATGFYAVNDLVDYTDVLVPPIHSLLPGQRLVEGSFTHAEGHVTAAVSAVADHPVRPGARGRGFVRAGAAARLRVLGPNRRESNGHQPRISRRNEIAIR